MASEPKIHRESGLESKGEEKRYGERRKVVDLLGESKEREKKLKEYRIVCVANVGG